MLNKCYSYYWINNQPMWLVMMMVYQSFSYSWYPTSNFLFDCGYGYAMNLCLNHHGIKYDGFGRTAVEIPQQEWQNSWASWGRSWWEIRCRVVRDRYQNSEKHLPSKKITGCFPGGEAFHLTFGSVCCECPCWFVLLVSKTLDFVILQFLSPSYWCPTDALSLSTKPASYV